MYKNKIKSTNKELKYWTVLTGNAPGVYANADSCFKLNEAATSNCIGNSSLLDALIALDGHFIKTRYNVTFPLIQNPPVPVDGELDLSIESGYHDHRSFIIRTFNKYYLCFDNEEIGSHFLFEAFCKIEFQSYSIYSCRIIDCTLLTDIKLFHKKLEDGCWRVEAGIFCVSENINHYTGNGDSRILFFNEVNFRDNFSNVLV